MRWINAEKVIHTQIYDDEYEECSEREMTIEELLDAFTDEGCPTVVAHPEQQWIPCSVRLPEELEEVNVTWINHDPEPYYDFVKGKPFTGSAVYYKEKWYWYSSTCTDILGEYGENDIDEVDDAIEITAWKPIGEPWKGEQE